jgi:hypothetical protein
MTTPKDTDRPPVHAIVLCVAVLLAMTPFSVWTTLHALGWRSTKVVERIEVERLDDRYTIPAKHYAYWEGPYTDGYMVEGWTEAKEVRYERWTITAMDGFRIVFDDVDPENPPRIRSGDRYAGWWK